MKTQRKYPIFKKILFTQTNETNMGPHYSLFFVFAVHFILFLVAEWNRQFKYRLCYIFKTTSIKNRLWNQNTVRGRLVRASQALIQSFPICTSDMVKDQFGLFLLLRNTKKYPSASAKMSIYREDFVTYRETVRFELKPWDLAEAVVERCSAKRVFLKILQNSQDNTCTRLFF